MHRASRRPPRRSTLRGAKRKEDGKRGERFAARGNFDSLKRQFPRRHLRHRRRQRLTSRRTCIAGGSNSSSISPSFFAPQDRRWGPVSEPKVKRQLMLT